MYFPLDSMSPCKHTRLQVPVHCNSQKNRVGSVKLFPDLLEVGSKPVHVLVIGEQGMILSMEEVDVPYPQQGQQDGGILVQGSSAEVVVLKQRSEFLSCSPNPHIYSTCDQLLKDLPSNELLKEAFQSCQNLVRTEDTTDETMFFPFFCIN